MSIWLGYHVLAMFVSPWAVPPTSQLAISVQSYVAHYQTVLYLNHGYRFFAPDPGPANIVGFSVIKADGSQINGIFPDRNAINRDYPRLNYHRWFMWSETLGRMFSQWVSPSDFARYVELENARADELRQSGLALEADRVMAGLNLDQQVWAVADRDRVRILTRVAQELLKRHQGVELRLTMNQRMIPSLSEARAGMQTSDSRLLEPERAIELGRWRWDVATGSAQILEAGDSPSTEPTIEEFPTRSESSENE
ncbi:MAG: hypothetical protein JNL67_04970 [Planctomycetaceae bacterium]|nr:hypothetical protein [Planctomycetaceae bacterium]